MPSRVKNSVPKQIVYLWGAGGTQAEINYLGAETVNLLMRDNPDLGEGVARRVLKRLPRRWQTAFASDQEVDIEKLISLLSATNVAEYHQLAGTIRRHYFDEICQGLLAAKILPDPKLAVALFVLHSNEAFKRHEKLTGIITTNHDGLLQVAAQRVTGAVNIGIPFTSTDFTPAEPVSIPLLHLHGSFTWAFGIPLAVAAITTASSYSADTVWIPPTILKESKSYPFNKLAALAYELLCKHCDVLRIVGSSLTQNDWNVLSMVFNAQRHRRGRARTPFRVELIMGHGIGLGITKECSYLEGLTPLGFLTDGAAFAECKGDDGSGVPPEVQNPEIKNPLFFWLKQKVTFHQRRGDLGAAIDNVLKGIMGEPV